jgi:hypothetical protein
MAQDSILWRAVVNMGMNLAAMYSQNKIPLFGLVWLRNRSGPAHYVMTYIAYLRISADIITGLYSYLMTSETICNTFANILKLVRNLCMIN